MYLAASLRYSFKTVDNDRRTRTEGYLYTLSPSASLAEEVASWHWHPSENTPRPHIHVGGEHKRLHLPTGRVTFEAVVRFTIEELDVVPERDDWSTVLEEQESLHHQYRGWS